MKGDMAGIEAEPGKFLDQCSTLLPEGNSGDARARKARLTARHTTPARYISNAARAANNSVRAGKATISEPWLTNHEGSLLTTPCFSFFLYREAAGGRSAEKGVPATIGGRPGDVVMVLS